MGIWNRLAGGAVCFGASVTTATTATTTATTTTTTTKVAARNKKKRHGAQAPRQGSRKKRKGNSGLASDTDAATEGASVAPTLEALSGTVYAERGCVRVWGQRGTLHLYNAEQWPALMAAFGERLVSRLHFWSLVEFPLSPRLLLFSHFESSPPLLAGNGTRAGGTNGDVHEAQSRRPAPLARYLRRRTWRRWRGKLQRRDGRKGNYPQSRLPGA